MLVVLVRRLFERIVTLSLSRKQMQYFYKRFLKFEKEYGDAQSAQRVLEMAHAYVNSKNAAAGDDDAPPAPGASSAAANGSRRHSKPEANATSDQDTGDAMDVA